jgi:hypothetical protein
VRPLAVPRAPAAWSAARRSPPLALHGGGQPEERRHERAELEGEEQDPGVDAHLVQAREVRGQQPQQ